MSEEKKKIVENVPLKKGYQPTQDLDTSKPPKGGSGISSESSGDNKKTVKKD